MQENLRTFTLHVTAPLEVKTCFLRDATHVSYIRSRLKKIVIAVCLTRERGNILAAQRLNFQTSETGL